MFCTLPKEAAVEKKEDVPRVGWATITCSVALVFRAAMVFCSVVWQELPTYWSYISLYYVTCEVLPLAHALFVLRLRPPVIKDLASIVVVDERSKLMNR